MKRNMQSATRSETQVDREVRNIIADILDVDESAIHPSSRFRNDLGADSLDIVMLIMAFSAAFDAEICDKDVLHIQTVGEAVAYLEQHLLLQGSQLESHA